MQNNIKEEKIMKKVYERPEVEYINFYSEEVITAGETSGFIGVGEDHWDADE